MSEKAIDVTRVKRTRGGHEVRIYATDGNSHYPIHGAWRVDGTCHWIIECWTSDGLVRHGAVSDRDLVEEPATVEIDGWVNVRLNKRGMVSFGMLHDTPEEAHKLSDPSCIACIRIQRTITKGEGLDAK